MNNLNETIGLRIESTNPSHLSTNVNVWHGIKVTFSSDVDQSTLARNIVVFEDFDNIYENIESLKDYSKYGVVKGSITYSDRVMEFTPEEKFKTNTRYIMIINNQVTDITGNVLVQKSITVFTTEEKESYPPCVFTSPKYGLITGFIPEFTWEDQGSPSYQFQMSKNNTFELLLYDKFVSEPRITPDFNFNEGVYFARVKSENGEWSDVHQIFIKVITDAVVAKEDTNELLSFEDFMEGLVEPVQVAGSFPENESLNVSLKTNILCIKIKGKKDFNSIDFSDCYVYGTTIDEEHEEYSHGFVDGEWTTVYDSNQDITYIIFTPTLN